MILCYRILHENPKPGDIVAVELETIVREQKMVTQYFRGIVMGLVNQNNMNPKAIVKLIDQGYVENISVNKIKSYYFAYQVMCGI